MRGLTFKKRMIGVMLGISMTLGLTACGQGSAAESNDTGSTSAPGSTQAEASSSSSSGSGASTTEDGSTDTSGSGTTTAAGAAGTGTTNSRDINNDGKLVILIDAGHDSKHPGSTNRWDAKEEDMTLTVAKDLEEKLKQYDNVTVYMTRETSACPYPDSADSVEDNRSRCAYAETVAADFMISLHFNNSGSGDDSANGSLILIQNENYEPTYNAMGQELGNLFLKELGSLGFADRGLQTKEMTDDVEPEQQTYPDGSRTDYYAILHHAKLHHVPAVIVEHGFMTNESDYEKMDSDEKLDQLAGADEAAIVSYFGLEK